jgi:hypothetical protein
MEPARIRWAHTRLSTKACASEGDGGHSTGSGMDIVKLVGAEREYSGAARLALRAAGPKPPALNLAFGQVPLHGVSEPGLFYVAGSTRMAISMPNCHGTIFLKMVGATGFEPATLWSQTRCATRLRHAPSLPTSAGRVGAVILPRFAWATAAIERRFRPRATTPAPAKSRAASKCSCRTARPPDRPPPSPFDCAGRAKDSTP